MVTRRTVLDTVVEKILDVAAVMAGGSGPAMAQLLEAGGSRQSGLEDDGLLAAAIGLLEGYRALLLGAAQLPETRGQEQRGDRGEQRHAYLVGADTHPVEANHPCGACRKLASPAVSGAARLSKILIIGIFLGIVVSMGSALSFLIKDKGQSNRTLHALTVRIIVSIALFALLFVLWGLGLISPHGIRP